MEAVASASAMVGLIAFSGDILCAGYGYIAKVAKAPVEIRMYLSEVASLNMLLDRLQMLSVHDQGLQTNYAVQTLADLGVFRDCHEMLSTVSAAIGKCRQIEGHDMKNLGRALLWPFKEKDTKDTLNQLVRLRDTISTALAVDSAAALKELREVQNRIHVKVDSLKDFATSRANHEKDKRVMKWLRPEEVDPNQNYEVALLSRQPLTGKWFLDSDIFNNWFKAGKSSFLWLHAIPGCGKTVLCSTVIEQLRSSMMSQDTGLAYFYFDHRDSRKQNLRNFAATAIAQLVKQSSRCYVQVEKWFDSRSHELDQRLPSSEYGSLLKVVAGDFPRTMVVVDALDECNDLPALVQCFQELLLTSDSTSMNILATSRNDLSIERLVLPLATSELSLMRNIREDIVTYVTTEVDDRVRSKRLKLRNPDLGKQIKIALLKNSDGMFLRAKIQLEYLSNLGSDRAIKEALNVLPQGLEDTYEGVLRRIISSNPGRVEEIKCIFRWLIGSEYILNLQELAEAVSINAEDTRLDPDGITTDPEGLAALCGSLVTVNRRYDPPEISFAHYSIEEYLRSAMILKSPMAEFYMDPRVVDLQLANTCLQYLSFSDFEIPLSMEDPSRGCREQRLAQYSLLDYAANQWHCHLKKSQKSSEALDEAFIVRLDWFLNPNIRGGQYRSWQQVVRSHYASIKHQKAFVLDLSIHPPLYNSIVLGLDAVTTYLLNRAPNIAKMKSRGLTTLHAAALQGHGSVITKLLEAGVPVNAITTDKINRRVTALHIAAEAGHVEAVRILLAAGASPHARSTARTTPFYKAARGGSLPVLELLHDAGSDVNVHTWDDWTPIFEAIRSNHLPVVKRLLGWGADIEVMSDRGYTPLCEAIRANLLPMVELLLQRGANPEAKNKDNYTPLTLAKKLNRGAIVELLESISEPPREQMKSAHNESEQALQATT